MRPALSGRPGNGQCKLAAGRHISLFEAQMDDKKLLALAKKNAAKSADIEKKRKKKTYDATLDVTRPEDPPEDSEADAIFREMKKREF